MGLIGIIMVILIKMAGLIGIIMVILIKNGGPYWDYYGYFNKRRGQCVSGTNLIGIVGGCWGPIRL